MMVGNGLGDGLGGFASALEDGEPVETEATLDRAIQSRIGEQLRAMYDGLMEQPVPDRFHALLARLGDTGGLEGPG